MVKVDFSRNHWSINLTWTTNGLNFTPKSEFLLLQISFFIPAEQIPGRLGLLVTLSLCMFNTLNSVSRYMPRTKQSPVALVRWILWCMKFEVAALFEYAWILYGNFYTNKIADAKNDSHSWRPNYLDKIMIIFFPVCFAVFSAVFWTVMYKNEDILLSYWKSQVPKCPKCPW